jgi:hypothetical protein
LEEKAEEFTLPPLLHGRNHFNIGLGLEIKTEAEPKKKVD